MDKIVCLIETRQVLVYLLRAGRWCFHGTHTIADLPVVLRNLGSWKSTLHLLDLSASTQFKWEKVPGTLSWFERLQWLREKAQQSRCEGDYWIFKMNLRKSWIWFLKTAQSALPTWIEEKLSSQLGAMLYHNYALELVRGVKSYFPISDGQFQCLILQRTESPCIIALYQGNGLKFLRLLSPMPQESVIYLIQETVRHVEEVFRIQDMLCLCFSEYETDNQALQHFLPQAQFFSGVRLERWLDQHAVLALEQGYHPLDRLVLACESRYQRLYTKKKLFFLYGVEQWLRKFSWIHGVFVVILASIHGIQWYRTQQLHKHYDVLCRRWQEYPWTYEQFLRIYPQCLKNYHQYHNVCTIVKKLDTITDTVAKLHKLEWTQNKSRYWFDFLASDSILQKNALLAQWRRCMPPNVKLEWKEAGAGTLLPEAFEDGYFESNSPFASTP